MILPGLRSLRPAAALAFSASYPSPFPMPAGYSSHFPPQTSPAQLAHPVPTPSYNVSSRAGGAELLARLQSGEAVCASLPPCTQRFETQVRSSSQVEVMVQEEEDQELWVIWALLGWGLVGVWAPVLCCVPMCHFGLHHVGAAGANGTAPTQP